MSFDEQSAATKTRSLFARKEKSTKKIVPKRISRECFCLPNRRLRSTRNKTRAVRCKTGIPVAARTHNKARFLPRASAYLLVEFDAQSRMNCAMVVCLLEARHALT
jgi:hypothetical protein